MNGGTAQPGVFVNWYPFGEPSTSPGCLDMVPPDGWEAKACTEVLPCVCERY